MISEAILERCAQIPDAPAVSDDLAPTWSYRELRAIIERRADELSGARWVTVLREMPPRRFLVDVVAGNIAGAWVGCGTTRTPERGAALPPGPGLVLTTSGSTGSPRHILLSERGTAANIEAIRSYLPVGEGMRIAIHLPLWHGYALTGQALLGLCAGAHLHFIPRSLTPKKLYQRLCEASTDGLSTVSPILAWLAEIAGGDGAPPWQPRFLASAGGRLDRPVARQVLDRFPGVLLFDQYGLTEAGPRVSAIEASDPRFWQGSVGRSLPGFEVWCEDSLGRRLDPGDEGELMVGGPSLAIGELGRLGPPPDAVATGDLGRIDEDGYLTVVSRLDDRCKVAGEWVVCGRVATELARADGVRDAAVIAIDDPRLGSRLIAFLEADHGGVVAAARKQALGLPPSHRPRSYRCHPSLPRLPSGKIARLELLRMAEDDPQRTGEWR